GERREDGDRLEPELRRVAVDEAVRGPGVHGDRREHAGRERAPGPTHAMHPEDVERVVDAQALGDLDPEVAERAGAEADEDGRRYVDVPRRRCDRDEPGDRPRGRAEDARSALV